MSNALSVLIPTRINYISLAIEIIVLSKRSNTHTIAFFLMFVIVERQDGIVVAEHSVRLSIGWHITFVHLDDYLTT